MVKDHATEKIAKHHFSIPKCVNEDGISDLLNKFYAADFMENQTLPSNGINEKLNEVSAGDIKFLKLMDEGRTRCNGNCHCHSEILKSTYQTTDGCLKGDCSI